ncbi:TPA: hypothetical protein DDW35_13240 [Candidatus Sumerlaeota bacterium]|nr:hypothetical protein [Candidatus Sumerlaeota bacterium]
MRTVKMWLAGLAVVASLALSGCSSSKDEAKMPPRAPAEAIAAGHVVIVDIQADGHWWESGFLATPGDMIAMEMVSDGAFLGPNTLQARFGKNSEPLFVTPGKPLRIDKQEHIYLRVNPEAVKKINTQLIRVRIVNSKTK